MIESYDLAGREVRVIDICKDEWEEIYEVSLFLSDGTILEFSLIQPYWDASASIEMSEYKPV